MATITASMVKELRARTDAPMMDCKKALTEAEANMDRAEEILRVRFGNKASKSSGRVAAEGVVGISLTADSKTATLIEVNSETDFCAKNEDFLAYVGELAAIVNAGDPADIDALAALPMQGATVEETRAQLAGKIGENITPRRFVRIAAEGKVASYIHGNKIGVIVDVVGGDDELGKDIAMHIAAAKPKALSEDGIDAALIEAERRVAIEKATEAGKPEVMLEKIADGTVRKFLKEVTLLNQIFVKNDKMTITELLKSKDASIASFTMFTVGEGIEKEVVDYAAEVAAAAAAV
ncbi:MAG: translation elongation factor Ts [Methylophilaceae bacterium]|jgi:elongation factor Ts|nr:translation elongation factor Ts [Methylophilaceae bacterium]|tara:strand:- start:152 stop:1030 length:879 start_codon:yes stop_codon:yes gene_type:complete